MGCRGADCRRSLFAGTPAEQPPSSPVLRFRAGRTPRNGGEPAFRHAHAADSLNISITNDGPIRVEKARKIIFEGPRVHMVTDTGVEVFADYAQADMDRSRVFLKGNLSIYQSDSKTRTNSLIRASSAEFDWENEVLLTDAIRAKMEGADPAQREV